MTVNDARKDSGIRFIRFGVLFFIWTCASLLFIPVSWTIAPDVETRVYPPLREQSISDVHLKPDDPNFLLWKWHFRKNRAGYPLFISFMAFEPKLPASRVPVEVFTDWGCTRNFRSDRAAPADYPRVVTMCARLPPYWAGRPDIHVEGYAEYKVRHPFYTVPMRIPWTVEGAPEAE